MRREPGIYEVMLKGGRYWRRAHWTGKRWLLWGDGFWQERHPNYFRQIGNLLLEIPR